MPYSIQEAIDLKEKGLPQVGEGWYLYPNEFKSYNIARVNHHNGYYWPTKEDAEEGIKRLYGKANNEAA